jgi:hypothetical protein
MEHQKALTKDDMLTMIRHGANTIFASKDGTITDEDIATILEKSQEKTKALNERMEKLGESSLRDFTLEAYSLYQFEGQDYRTKQKEHGNPDQWIEPPKRERRVNVNYQEAAMFRFVYLCFRLLLFVSLHSSEEMSKADPKAKKAPRPKSIPNLLDFQFFPKRLFELFDKQIYYYRKELRYQVF